MKTILSIGIIAALLAIGCDDGEKHHAPANVISVAAIHEGDSLYEAGLRAYEQQAYDSCAHILGQAVRTYVAEKAMGRVAETCLALGELYNEVMRLDSAKKFLRLGIQYAETSSKLDSIQGRLWTNLAGTYQLQGDMRAAITHYMKALAATKASGDIEAYIVNCSALGVSYRRMNNPDSALFYYEQGLDAAAACKDYSSLANLYDNVAVMYGSSKRIESAKDYAFKAIPFAEKGNVASDIIQAYFIYGSLLEMDEKHDQAIIYLRRAYEKAVTQPSPRLMVKIISAMLPAFGSMELNDSVRHYLAISKKYVDKLPPTSNEAIGICEAQASIYHKDRNYEACLATCEKLLALRQINPSGAAYKWYAMMADCYASMGNDKRALKHMRRAFELQDTATRQKVEEQMSDFQVRYQTKEKELEINRLRETQLEEEAANLRLFAWLIAAIALLMLTLIILLYKRKLQKEKAHKMAQETELRLSRKYVEGMENERKRLARELHDGICNDLFALEMEIQQNENGKIADSAWLSKLDEARENIRTISHELMPPVFSYATLDEMIEDFISHIRSNGHLKVDFAADRFEWSSLPGEVGYELYRIVQEAVNNILKHSAATKATVRLLIPDGKTVRLMVQNDGEMLPVDTKGVGLRTMQDRAKSVNGSLIFEKGEKSVRLIVEIPLTKKEN